MNRLFMVIALMFFSSYSTSDGWTYENFRGGRGGDRGHHYAPGRGSFRGHGNGHIGNATRFVLPRAPYGGWRGHPYFYGGYNYHVWNWGPWCPFYGWPYYTGWRIGLYYYIPEGMRCEADNPNVGGTWESNEIYYSSEDAINSALGFCENDAEVLRMNASSSCRIRDCQRW
jgi:hypothetical protein